jgi:nicotinamidase-related amidase
MEKATKEFLSFLPDWMAAFPTLDVPSLFAKPEKVAILSVDMTNAFCREGSLASPRVAALIDPITRLFQLAWNSGVRQMVLSQDCHTPDAQEFDAYAPHAICGSSESEAVDEFKALPFYDRMEIFTKNSVAAEKNSGLDPWIASHPELSTFIVVGDCTDICVYSLAMHLRTYANAFERDWRVIVPSDCVDTYDLPLEAARSAGALPHPGDLMHAIFLYHMALNGIEVVRTIA